MSGLEPLSAPPMPRAGAGAWSLPGLCAICRGWGRGRVCGGCLGRFAPPQARCTRCALPLPATAATSTCGRCVARPPPYDAAIAAFDYAPPWDRLITAFKFHAALELAGVFATGLAEAWRAGGTAPPELLLPVPLAPARLRERGYNQAWEIARRLGRRLAIDADPLCVLRVRETAHQLELPPSERADNVRAAFAVEPARRARIAGHRVAVVDDVMTTGHTLAELARALKLAGAAAVDVWIVARTPRPDDGAA